MVKHIPTPTRKSWQSGSRVAGACVSMPCNCETDAGCHEKCEWPLKALPGPSGRSPIPATETRATLTSLTIFLTSCLLDHPRFWRSDLGFRGCQGAACLRETQLSRRKTGEICDRLTWSIWANRRLKGRFSPSYIFKIFVSFRKLF